MKTFIKETKNLFSNTFTSFYYIYKASPWRTVVVVATIIANALIPFMTSKVSSNVINTLTKVVKMGESSNTALELIVIYALLSGVQDLTDTFRGYIQTRWRYDVQRFVEFLTLNKRASIDIARHEDRDFQNLIQRGFGQKNYWPLIELGQTAIVGLWGVTGFVTASLILGLFDWRIYLLIFLTSLPTFIINIRFGRQNYNIWQRAEGEEQRRYANYRSHIFNSARLIEAKMYQATGKIIGWIKDIHDKTTDDIILTERNRLTYTVSSEILMMLGYGLALIIIVERVFSGEILIGTMTFYIFAISKLTSSVSRILSDLSTMYDSNMYVVDIIAFMKTTPHITTPHAVFAPIHDSKAPEIRFENVSFAYPDNLKKNTLYNITMTLYPGEKIGLVGNNGAGKSTLIKLLCRVYDPTEGRILINGVDLKNIDQDEWQSHLSVLLQDFASYELPIKEAIAISDPSREIDIERVRQSALASQADIFIQEYENKYNEQLGKEFGGKSPSKGQRQKLALARTFYRQAPILMLDEPTSAIDAESEVAIFKALDQISKDITTIYISHNFATIRRAQRIIVLDHGEVTEDGTHNELMSANKLYAEIFREQVTALTHNKHTE